METKKGENMKISCAAFEAVGTAFVTYGLLVTQGTANYFGGPMSIASLMMAAFMMICYDVTGGHFNPAITLCMTVAVKQF